MPDLNPDQTVGTLVVERPARARVFERAGIDYCCGGRRSLREACSKAGVELDEMLDALRKEDAAADAAGGAAHANWADAPLAELADHVEATHHAFLREELPRLAGLIDKVVAAHAQREPRYPPLRDEYRRFRDELEHHMTKEERMLFPAIRALDAEGSLPARFPFTTLADPIRIMHSEHDHAGAALERMRALTDGYRPPPDACNTVRALFEGLERIERDTHLHVHKENNILFPRALALEAEAAATS